MAEFLQISFLATVVQAAGTVLVTGLLVPLSRAMPGRFLRLWAAAWVCQAIGLLAFFLSTRLPTELRPPLQTGYLLAGDLFAFLVWAGCRKLASDRDLRPVDLLILVGPAAFAVYAPIWAEGRVWRAFPVHAAVLSALFLMALLQAAKFPGRAAGPAVGRWVVRGALAALVVLFAHYTVVVGFLTGGSVTGFEYLAFASLFDVFLQTALAFGLVILTADRARELLEERNRALAAAAAELDGVARTDPLTGLLNRRGFEQVLAASAGQPAAGSVAVIDLNDLKKLNDAHGHPAGDAALQLLARSLRGRFRVTDPICRIGGDEFVVVLADGTPQELCGRLAGMDLELAGQRLPGAVEAVDLCVAWGVAGYDADLPAATEAADRAMYARKRLMKTPARVAV